MTIYDPIGHIGAFLITLSLLPQVIKSFKTRKTRDISLLWTVTLTIGMAIWLFYVFANNIVPSMVFTTIEFFMILALLVLKLIYK